MLRHDSFPLLQDKHFGEALPDRTSLLAAKFD
jgi:hypothetical protein